MKIQRILSTFAAALLCVAAFAQTNSAKIYPYTPGDGGILYTMTRGNRWAIINLGTTASGGDAASQLFDMETGEHFPVTYSGRKLQFTMASNDGNTIVDTLGGYAMTYNRATNVIRTYPNRPLWKDGQLVDVTPDGRYAVGYYEGYLGNMEGSDLPNDWFYRTLFVDTETGDTIHTPNLPTTNRMGGRLQSIKFSSITPDGRYITGAVDWYLDGGYSFIYDVQQQKVVSGSFMKLYGGDVASRHPEVISCDGSMLSPDGMAIGGTARIQRINSEGHSETVSAPCVYFRQTDELRVYAHAEESNVHIEAMDNAGTFFGITETGTPLRDFKILYDGKYWVTLNQVCKQRYGFDFYERTGFERTGTLMGVSGDGHRIISFPDPMGESYCFDFGESVEEACSKLDVLSSYSVNPEEGSQFSRLSTLSIQFERPVQILGSGRNIHLYDSNGTLVANGLSSASGLVHKTGSQTTVLATFRTRLLNEGERYTVVVDSGAIATSVDASYTNKTITVHYVGRKDGPVTLLSSTPADHSTVQKIDNSSSYILLTFDCKVRLTDSPLAYIERMADGSRAATLNMVAGSEERTRNQVLLYPSSTINLFSEQDYRIVVAPGSISDFTGNEVSLNDSIIVTLHGSYVRVVPTGEVLFQDSWDNISESLQMWLRYEGDHNTPLASMKAWEFDADNQPWNFSIREAADTYDYCAASHSLYTPSGQSDDWMLTPQISLPSEGKVKVEFDAQSYNPNRADTLEVYVYEQPFTLSYLSDEWMQDIKADAQLVFKEILSAGESQEYLSGEWTHYTIDLTPWLGKDIYVAFVNHNRNQSAIFIDNVIVQREVPYLLALDFEDRVLNKTEQAISGKFTVKKAEPVSTITLVLRDSEGGEVSRLEWKDITSSVKDRPIPFSFPTPLLLSSGDINTYTIDITLDDTHDTYRGTISDLAFLPQRRVVLEEMTGVGCPNCPQGIVSIEKMQQAFGDSFIPISLHVYTGDPYESGMTPYAQFLGLNAAPSARINRTGGIYFPMYSDGTDFTYTRPEESLWYDVVSKELDRLALCDVNVKATVDDNKEVTCTTSVRYALRTDNQQLSLLLVVLEDGLTNYQSNAFGLITSPALGEWGANGSLSGVENNGYVYPVTHNDVARAVIGTTIGGTIGLFPSSFTPDSTYTTTQHLPLPTTLVTPSNARVVTLILDSQSGEVLNAAQCPLLHEDNETSVSAPESPITNHQSPVFTLQGTVLPSATHLSRGIYIKNGKKIVVR